MLTKFKNAQQTHQLKSDIEFWQFLLRLDNILKLQHGLHTLLIPKEAEEIPEEYSVVRLEITDFDGHGVSLPDFSRTIDGLLDLYNLLAQYLLADKGVPRIAYVDSGSNIALWLTGGKELIEAVEKLFTNTWNTIVYRRNVRLERDIASASEGIEFIATLRHNSRNGDLDADTASRLEHAITARINTLVSTGMMLSEIPNALPPDRRAVLEGVRQLKLLTAGVPSEDGITKIIPR